MNTSMTGFTYRQNKQRSGIIRMVIFLCLIYAKAPIKELYKEFIDVLRRYVKRPQLPTVVYER